MRAAPRVWPGAGGVLADRLDADPALLGRVLASGTLGPGQLQLHLVGGEIASALGLPVEALSSDLLAFAVPFALRRRGVETRIIAGEMLPRPDPVLQRTLAEAHGWARSLRAGTPLAEIAATTGHSEPYIRTRIPLAFLAPDLQSAILDGQQPATLSVAQMLREGIPMDWDAQARLFGIR
jgi:site-specific DNA recombinase